MSRQHQTHAVVCEDRGALNPDDIPLVLYVAVTRRDLTRAFRRGDLRLKKQRVIRLAPTRERALASFPGGMVVRVDVTGALADGVHFARAEGEFSVNEIPLRFLSCSRVPGGASDVRVVEAAGGVVVRDGPEPRVLVLRKLEGKSDSWVLPKGKRRSHENEIETAVREVVEETGLDRVIVERFIAHEHYFDTTKGRCQFKRVAYYLMRCPGDATRPRVRRKEGFIDAKWMTLDEAFEATKPLRAHKALRKAIKFLHGRIHHALAS
jgi:8-oxo-dGTP pyrophosphatase MutT (NUDIX family)